MEGPVSQFFNLADRALCFYRGIAVFDRERHARHRKRNAAHQIARGDADKTMTRRARGVSIGEARRLNDEREISHARYPRSGGIDRKMQRALEPALRDGGPLHFFTMRNETGRMYSSDRRILICTDAYIGKPYAPTAVPSASTIWKRSRVR